MRDITKIIIHCSASDRKEHDSVECIRYWHIGQGWSDIGYHYVITKDGKVHIGRNVEQVGAHCKGYNSHSIGICLTGNIEFSEDQFDSLRILVDSLIGEYDLDYEDVYPHSYFNEHKTCPNFDLDDIIFNEEV